jgi:hypothetical protein
MENTAITFTIYYFVMGYLRSLNYFHSNSIATEYREPNGFEYLIPLAYKLIGFSLIGFAAYFSYAFKWWAGPIVWIVNYLLIAPILGNYTLKLFGISVVRFFSWIALIYYFSIIHELLNIKF